MEVVTYGGGEFIRDMFNAVAAVVGLGGFASALRLTLVLGLLYTLFLVAFSQNFMTTIRWFVATLLIYLCLLVPKTSVQIVDRFDPALPGANVANVPIGLALIASLTSTVGDKFTEITEDTFSLPTDLEYQENGFIYGSKIFKDAMSFQVTDAVFGENLSGFIRTCVFYDLLEHRYSVTELRETDNLWAMLTVVYPPNPARFYEWVQGGGVTVVKACDQAASDLDSQWASEVNRVAQIYGKQIAPQLTEAAAQALVLGSLADAHDFFLGSARAASEQIQQTTIANIIDKAVRDQGAELDADALLDAYGQARMESEMNHAIKQGSRLAERFVPLFRTVAEALFYGLFPILFPIFLLPESGMRLLRGYTGGFVTLMAWGPIFVILHRIMMGTAGSRSLGAGYTPTSGEAITLVTQTGIEAVHADIAMIAGYMTLMVPFAAGALGRGAMAFAGLSQSFLHPAQMAAQSSAREVSTGNVSLGNTSFGTHRFNSVEGNRHATSSFVDTGEGSWNTPEGGRMRATASGGRVYDGMGAISRGGTHVDYQSGLSTAFQSEASWSLEQRDAAAQRSSHARSALAHNISDLTWQMSEGKSFEDASGYSLDTRQSESVNKMVLNASKFAERFSEGKESRFGAEAYVAAAASKGLAVPLLGRAKMEAGLRGNAGWDARRSEIYEAAREAVRQDGAQETYDDVVGTFERANASESGSENHSWREAFAANLQESQSASHDLETYQARADAARELASQVTREGSNSTANWDNAFLNHMAGRPREDGHAIGVNEAARRWTSGDLADRMWVEAEAREFINEEAGHLLDRPDLEGFRAPAGPAAAPADLTDVETAGDAYQAHAEEMADGVSFDEGRHKQIRGTQNWTGQRHEMSVARLSGKEEELAQLRKLTVQSRVQDSRDAEWDAFAGSDPNSMDEKSRGIWEKGRRLTGVGGVRADGEDQRVEENRMPDQNAFSEASHYRTGAERL
ncbi:MAG: conjugal transfer protein TraG N-terminal domain-containing protein, partial [Pseudomonadota bacterium]